MKILLILSCLVLALPVLARQDSASLSSHGLVVTGPASTTVKADTCDLLVQLVPDRGFGRGGLSTPEEIRAQAALIAQKPALIAQKRQSLSEAIQPWGLKLATEPVMVPHHMGGSYALPQNDSTVTIRLSINTKNEVVFGKATAPDVFKTLAALEMSSSFIFSLSSEAQTAALKPLLALAIKNGITEAKSLGALAGASQIRLSGLREQGSTFFQPVTTPWLTEGTLTAPEQTLYKSVTLLFAPLDVVISTKK